MSSDNLGDRMKGYEDIWRNTLPERLPVIIRLDGRAFHSYTRDAERPYDQLLMNAMDNVAMELCGEAGNCVLAYIQSDEISLLLTQKSKDSQPWFANNVQKMTSVSASLASVRMTLESPGVFLVKADKPVLRPAQFDARAFIIPPHEVVNYFIWRQQDWIRNSVQMLARAHYSHKQLDNKSQSDMHEMLHQKGVNWALLTPDQKNGRCVIKVDTPTVIPAGPMKGETIIRPKWTVDHNIPVFTQDRAYIESRMVMET
jgi:tRNA(His) guanylyltransferase